MDKLNNITWLLSQLVSIPSTSGKEEKIIEFIYSLLKDKHNTVTLQKVEKNRKNIIVSKGNSGKSVLLYGHVDTIPKINGWKTNPYKPVINNDRLFGLGAWDMKVVLELLITLFNVIKTKNISIKLALCVDEENISRGGYRLIKSHFIKNVLAVVSPEPAFVFGNSGLVIGRAGRAVYEVFVTGKSRHYALYSKKYDCCLRAGKFIKLLPTLYVENKLRKQFAFVSSIKTNIAGMSLPNQCDLVVDTCVIPPNTHASMLESLRAIANSISDEHIKITIRQKKRETPYLEAYEFPLNNQYVQLMCNSIKKITGKKAKPYFRSSLADDNIFGFNNIPVLGVGAVGDNAHAPNEWVSLSSLRTLYNIIKDFIISVDNSVL